MPPKVLTKGRSIDYFRQQAGPFIYQILQNTGLGIDPFLLVLENVKAKAAIPVKLESAGRCLAAVSGGVAVACEDGQVIFNRGRTEEFLIGHHHACVTAMLLHRSSLITGTTAGEIAVWSVESRQQVARIKEQGAGVSSLLVSKDGEELFSVSGECDIETWSLETYAKSERRSGRFGLVSHVLQSPCGSFLIFGSEKSSIVVWSLRNNREEFKFKEEKGEISALAITTDGRFLISGTDSGTGSIWEIPTRSKKARLDGHQGSISTIVTTPDDKTVLSASTDKTVSVWSIEGTWIAALSGHVDKITCLLTTVDGKLAVTGSLDSFIKVWSLHDFTEVGTLRGHSNAITALTLSEDGSRLISASRDSSVRWWCLGVAQTAHPLFTCSGGITSLRLSPRFLLASSADFSLTVYDCEALTVAARLTGHRNCVVATAVSPNGKLAASGADDFDVKVWSLESFQEVHTFSGHFRGVTSVIFTPDGRFVISASSDCTAKVWDLLTTTHAATLPHKNSVMALVVVSSGEGLLTGSLDNTIVLWSLQNFARVATLSGHSAAVMELVVPLAEDRLFSRGSDGSVKVWNLGTLTDIHTIAEKGDFITCFAVSSDGKWMVTASREKKIRVKNAVTFVEISVLTGHCLPISLLRLTPDDSHVISADSDSSFLIFSLDSMREVSRFHIKKAKDIAISADSGKMYSGGEDGCVRVTDIVVDIPALRKVPKALINTRSSELGKNSLFGCAVDMMRKGKKVHPITAGKAVVPYYFNGLHVCCYYHHTDMLADLLKSGVPIISGTFGSPVTVALRNNSRRCVDVILEHIIALCSSDKSWHSLLAITDDIPKIIATNSSLLPSFLESVFHPTTQAHLPYFIYPKTQLPIIEAVPNWYINPKIYEDSQKSLSQEVVEFLVCDFRWDFTSGSEKSLELLTALETCGNKSILTTSFISTLIHWKWNQLMPVTVSLTVIYVGLLLCLILIVFDFAESWTVKSIFFALNLFLLLYECVQCYVDTVGYWRDPWNYLDWARSSLCTVWVFFLNGNRYVDLLAVIMCFLRGFTYFRTFKMTRMFVRLTLEVVKEMYSFLVIFFYSTVAFGMMYAVLIPQRLDNAFVAWMTAYELLMGTYSTDGFEELQWLCFTFASLVNVIIMLNLLISILSDAYEQAQMSAKENDILEMLRIVLEYESMLFWRRSGGIPCVFTLCRKISRLEVDAYWEGKVSEITKAIRGKIAASEERVSKRSEDTRKKLEQLDEKMTKTVARMAKLAPQFSIRPLINRQSTLKSAQQSHETRLNALEDSLKGLETQLDALIQISTSSR